MTPRAPTVDEGYQRPADPDGLAGLSLVQWRIRTLNGPPGHKNYRNTVRLFTNLRFLGIPKIHQKGAILLGWQAPDPDAPLWDAGWLVGSAFYPPAVRQPLSRHLSAIREWDPDADPQFVEANHCQFLDSGLVLFPLGAAGRRSLSGVAGERGATLLALLRPRNAFGWVAATDDHLSLWIRCIVPPTSSPLSDSRKKIN